MLTDLLSHPIVAQLKALDAGVLKFCEKISPFQSDGFMFEIGPVCLNCWYEHENLDDKETTDFEVLNFDDDATEVQYVSSLFNDEFYTCESCNNLIYTDLRNLAYAAQLAAKLYEFSKSFTGDLDSLIDCTYCKKFGQLGAMTFPEKRAICTRCTDYDSLRRFKISNGILLLRRQAFSARAASTYLSSKRSSSVSALRTIFFVLEKISIKRETEISKDIASLPKDCLAIFR